MKVLVRKKMVEAEGTKSMAQAEGNILKKAEVVTTKIEPRVSKLLQRKILVLAVEPGLVQVEEEHVQIHHSKPTSCRKYPDPRTRRL